MIFQNLWPTQKCIENRIQLSLDLDEFQKIRSFWIRAHPSWQVLQEVSWNQAHLSRTTFQSGVSLSFFKELLHCACVCTVVCKYGHFLRQGFCRMIWNPFQVSLSYTLVVHLFHRIHPRLHRRGLWARSCLRLKRLKLRLSFALVSHIGHSFSRKISAVAHSLPFQNIWPCWLSGSMIRIVHWIKKTIKMVFYSKNNKQDILFIKFAAQAKMLVTRI